MELARETFHKRASRLLEKVVDIDSVEQDVWIAAAPVCSMHYINDGRYLADKETSIVECVWRVQNSTVQLYRTLSLDGAYDFHCHPILGIRVRCNINV